MSTRYETYNPANVTVSSAEGHKFKSEGVTCVTLIDGLLVGKTLSNGKLVPFAVSGFRVFKKFIADANRQERRLLVSDIIRDADSQERALLMKMIEDAEG